MQIVIIVITISITDFSSVCMCVCMHACVRVCVGACMHVCTSGLKQDHNHDDPDDLLTQRLRPSDLDDDHDVKEISSYQEFIIKEGRESIQLQ